jgi:TPR repeat protein
MAKLTKKTERLNQAALDALFTRASNLYDEGKFKAAFRLYLKGARAGDVSAQLNLGTLYTDGRRVRRNLVEGLYWYRRAYGRGWGLAAHNIGIVYRDEEKLDRALAWFERAVKPKDVDSNLEIAKIHIRKNDRRSAIRCLKSVCKAQVGSITEESREEAQELLARLR